MISSDEMFLMMGIRPVVAVVVVMVRMAHLLLVEYKMTITMMMDSVTRFWIH